MKTTHEVTRQRVLNLIGQPDYATEDSESAKDDLIRDLFGALIQTECEVARLIDQRERRRDGAGGFIMSVILALTVVVVMHFGFGVE